MPTNEGEVATCVNGRCVIGTDVPMRARSPVECPASSSGVFSTETDTSGLAVPALQCNGNGACIRFPTDACKDRDSAGCAAVCRCFAGWSGRGCAISDAAIEAVRILRMNAVRVLNLSLEQLEQATPDEAAQAVSVISGVFADPDELPLISRGLLQAILQSLLDKVLSSAAAATSSRDGESIINGTVVNDGLD